MSARTAPPATVTTRDGRVFKRLGETDYVRKSDGARMILVIWEGRCVLCDQPYRIRATARPSTRALAIVSCETHRGKTGRRRAKTAR